MEYYDGVIFHHVAIFMIQGGDPTGTGMGGRIDLWRKDLKTIFIGSIIFAGALSMANAGPSTWK